MLKWLQSNLAVSQWKIKNKKDAKISNNLWTGMVLLFGKTDRLALSQVPSTTLPQQMLQNRTVGRSSNYMARACLPLITLQNI